MAKLKEMAKLIRSKNAGPFQLTFDILFDDPKKYIKAKESGAISKAVISNLYGVPVKDVMFFFCDNALAIKASIPRPIFQGDLLDSDMHGGQQYAPLEDIEIS